MKKSVLLLAIILLGSLLFSFTTVEHSSENEIGFLPANCDNPIYFQIDSQQPFINLNVNPTTGELFIASQRETHGLCGTYNDNNERRIKVRYSVTNAEGLRKGHFIIIDLEQEE